MRDTAPHGGGSDGSFLHPKWDLGTFLNVICAGTGPCGCWDALPRAGFSTWESSGRWESRDDLFWRKLH